MSSPSCGARTTCCPPRTPRSRKCARSHCSPSAVEPAAEPASAVARENLLERGPPGRQPLVGDRVERLVGCLIDRVEVPFRGLDVEQPRQVLARLHALL